MVQKNAGSMSPSVTEDSLRFEADGDKCVTRYHVGNDAASASSKNGYSQQHSIPVNPGHLFYFTIPVTDCPH